MPAEKSDVGEEGDEGEESADWLVTVNKASALWTKSKSEISKDDYASFYKSSAGAWDEPSRPDAASVGQKR